MKKDSTNEKSAQSSPERIPDAVVTELYVIAENAPRQVKRYLLDYIFEKTGISVEITEESDNRELRFSRDTSILSLNPEYDEVRQLVDEIFTAAAVEDVETQTNVASKFICLFEKMNKLREAVVMYSDLFRAMQEYCFTYTKDFENAFESYKAKLNCDSQETKETDESNELEKHLKDNEPTKGRGGKTTTPILEVPQNLAFADNQRL